MTSSKLAAILSRLWSRTTIGRQASRANSRTQVAHPRQTCSCLHLPPIQGLPAGDYHLAAITDADPEDWQNPAFLEQLISASVRIRLIGGQPLVQGLRIGG